TTSALCSTVVSIRTILRLNCKGEDRVIQPTGDVIAAEGDTATLRCTFETRASPTLFWYKQEENDFPKYMMKSFSTSVEKEKQISMNISSAAVSDSAVYYCAVRMDRANTKAGYGTEQLNTGELN
uniref:Ig-like domain-containing protein n=1 Tax=Mastacembelus armatus TaxID=205130 RepID=A0A3Q3LK13_9TELE